MQGAGWLTTEELVWDAKGRLADPCAVDLQDPGLFGPAARCSTSALWDGANREDTVYRSKAVGEPPFMLGISAFLAISDAMASVRTGLSGAGRAGDGRAGADDGAAMTALPRRAVPVAGDARGRALLARAGESRCGGRR